MAMKKGKTILKLIKITSKIWIKDLTINMKGEINIVV